jgi:hypothetical protein
MSNNVEGKIIEAKPDAVDINEILFRPTRQEK